MSEELLSLDSMFGAPKTNESLFLIRVPVSHPLVSNKIKDYSDMNAWHKVVMSCFPDNLTLNTKNPRSNYGILFRLDYRNSIPQLLIQSKIKPKFDIEEIKTVSLVPLLDRYIMNQKVRVETVLNSVKTNPKTGKRISIPSPKLEEWIIGNKENERFNGLFPWLKDAVIIDITPIEKFRQGEIQLSAVSIKLEGTIEDVDGCLNMVRNGLGKARSYGCGLVTVLPIMD